VKHHATLAREHVIGEYQLQIQFVLYDHV
jgi:hypothetical protein